ncbi:hypothetical protein NDN08_005469 [Rhodosorus marinus]|uniref:Cilia- and flagella-associated protein 157 n=1 Tax=Rhodosorus marinus TaxID=101924 RepID=A0AAV8V1Q2_9RHOD|nr:hypothetical protein NDN08_005469 [Rhodosorus marinus]
MQECVDARQLKNWSESPKFGMIKGKATNRATAEQGSLSFESSGQVGSGGSSTCVYTSSGSWDSPRSLEAYEEIKNPEAGNGHVFSRLEELPSEFDVVRRRLLLMESENAQLRAENSEQHREHEDPIKTMSTNESEDLQSPVADEKISETMDALRSKNGKLWEENALLRLKLEELEATKAKAVELEIEKNRNAELASNFSQEVRLLEQDLERAKRRNQAADEEVKGKLKLLEDEYKKFQKEIAELTAGRQRVQKELMNAEADNEIYNRAAEREAAKLEHEKSELELRVRRLEDENAKAHAEIAESVTRRQGVQKELMNAKADNEIYNRAAERKVTKLEHVNAELEQLVRSLKNEACEVEELSMILYGLLGRPAGVGGASADEFHGPSTRLKAIVQAQNRQVQELESTRRANAQLKLAEGQALSQLRRLECQIHRSRARCNELLEARLDSVESIGNL